ncbi:amidase [Ensifer sp. ENS04]|uniref:amidase n=1 Tax=Ensifer sp. ENS04 TaxID=2769281 RepID=UPI00177BCF80|nr:amidase [Ensifer sp. ENS04]MBD9541391.1 amidase [Ensifer sp. ENS04]
MTLRRPSRQDIVALSMQTNVNLTEAELDVIHELVNLNMDTYDELDQMPDPVREITPAVRIPGARPTRDEDPLNAIVRYVDVTAVDRTKGPLSGKRIGIKDTVAVAGIPTTAASRLLYDYTPDVDATVVKRILEAGGHITAMLNTDDFSFSGAGHTSAYGPGLNPADPKYLAGGSSCGSASAVATGLVDMALGGDQGGSIRMPASWSGIVGLKATHGLVPYTGIAGFDPTIDHIGPMTRTVEDAALFLSVIAGKDETSADPRQPSHIERRDYSGALTGSIKGLRIAVVDEGFHTPESTEYVNATVLKAIEHLRGLGAIIETVSVPEHRTVMPIWTAVAVEGGLDAFNHGLAPYGTKAWYNTRQMAAMSKAMKTNGGDFSPTTKVGVILAAYMKQQYHGVFYGRAQNLSRRLTSAYDQVLSKYDLVVMPTTPQTAHEVLPSPEVDRRAHISQALNMLWNTATFDLTGHPSISVPCRDVSGLPVGLMFTGRAFDETTVLRAAHAYEVSR